MPYTKEMKLKVFAILALLFFMFGTGTLPRRSPLTHARDYYGAAATRAGYDSSNQNHRQARPFRWDAIERQRSGSGRLLAAHLY